MLERPDKLVDIVHSFDKRSGFFESESSWSTDRSLNDLCVALTKARFGDASEATHVLDYGAGSGALTKALSEAGLVVDAADVSIEMLRTCRTARRCFLMPAEEITGSYDRVVVRQVWHYFEADAWAENLDRLIGLLTAGGRLIFSEIVPYCSIDFDFWQRLTTLRRPTRRSHPTEVDFLTLCERLGYPTYYSTASYTRQSLREWVSREPPLLQRTMEQLFASAEPSVRTLWDVSERPDGDLTFRICWAHIVVGPRIAR